MRKFFWLVIFSIVFVPLFSVFPKVFDLLGIGIRFEGGDVWYLQYLGLYICLNLGISFVLWKFNKFVSLFSLLCLFSVVFGHDGKTLVFTQTPLSMITHGVLNLSFLASFSISKFSKDQRKIVVWVFLGLIVFQGFWVILQYNNLDPIFDGFGTYMTEGKLDDTVGFSGSHNQIGVFFASTAPVVIGLCPYLLPLVVFGLWCSTTSFAWGAFSISSILYVAIEARSKLKKKNNVLGISIILCVLIGSGVFFCEFENLTLLNDTVTKERFLLWKNTVKAVEKEEITVTKYLNVINGKSYWSAHQYIFPNNPGQYTKQTVKKVITCSKWFGYRLGNFIKISPYSQRDYFDYKDGFHVYSHAHNDFIEVFFELGRTGAIALFLIIIHFFWVYIRSEKTKILNIVFCCIVAQMLCALGVFTIHTALNGLLLVINYGLFCSEIRELNSNVRTKKEAIYRRT